MMDTYKLIEGFNPYKPNGFDFKETAYTATLALLDIARSQQQIAVALGDLSENGIENYPRTPEGR